MRVVNSIHNKANINSTRRKIQKVSGQYSLLQIPVIKINGTLTNNAEDVVNSLPETFASAKESIHIIGSS